MRVRGSRSTLAVSSPGEAFLRDVRLRLSDVAGGRWRFAALACARAPPRQTCAVPHVRYGSIASIVLHAPFPFPSSMRRRQQALPEPPLRAALPRHLAPREAAVCTCELAKTLLFLRAQLPALFDELRATVAEPAGAPGADVNGGSLPPGRPRRKRVCAADRRARKTLAAVEALEALLTPAVFADAALEARCAKAHAVALLACFGRCTDTASRASFQSVLLVLGASAARPREAYELRLSVARDGAGGSGSEPFGRDAGADAARRATRVLVGALADAPEALSGLSRANMCDAQVPCAHAAVLRSSHEALCAAALSG